MAAILHSNVKSEFPSREFVKLQSNPMFGALRDTLMRDVQTSPMPVSLIKTEPENNDTDDTLDANMVAIQEANLMSDFQQILPSGNEKVLELQEFYRNQCSSIENERNQAIQDLKENNMLSVSQYQRELNKIHVHHDQQRMHLTNRVTASLELLKLSIPSAAEVSSSKNKSRQLNSRAVDIMTDWYEKHIDHPYPTDEEKVVIANHGGLSLSQVKAWFANKRNRSNNTKPKKQKIQVEKKLLSICTELSGGQQARPRLYGDIIKQLSDIVNTSHAFNKGSGRLSDSYNSSGDELESFCSD
ncbi:homeobox protein ceh-40-like [Mya arenaria]|uniref:homeobox protein ceh-40-like n=1 Tax=Mya arenaria TaxID=6604 RepID=UPI0022E3E252|nr:homeobox protein ceh-40-like [Mya arenaria]